MKYDVDVAIKIIKSDGTVDYDNATGVYDANGTLLAAHKCFHQYLRAYRTFDKNAKLAMIEYTANVIEDTPEDGYADEVITLPKPNLFARICYDMFRVGKLYFTMLGVSTFAAMVVYCVRYYNTGARVEMPQYIVLTGSIIAFALTMVVGYAIIDHVLLGAYRRIKSGSSSALASIVSKLLTTIVAIPAFYGILYICIDLVFFGIQNPL